MNTETKAAIERLKQLRVSDFGTGTQPWCNGQAVKDDILAVCAAAKQRDDLLAKIEYERGESDTKLLRALRSRLSQNIAWFKNPQVNDKDWWVTDFTHDQIEGNLKQCVEIIDAAMKEEK